MPDDQTAAEDKPPYLSLTTLINFLDRWGDGPIPPRIDKSALDNYSGGTQAALMSTLRLMGYVNHEGHVLPALREAVRDADVRRSHLERWARHFYAQQLHLAEQGATSQMLHESFAVYGYSGSTLRKAVVFYLSLVEYLGLPNSPHFRPPKQSATPPSRRRQRSTPVSPRVESVQSRPVHVPTGDVTTIKIDNLATITVTVEAQWMKLPVETIVSMREAIAKLEALGSGHPEPA
jgi:hypothetical protein